MTEFITRTFYLQPQGSNNRLKQSNFSLVLPVSSILTLLENTDDNATKLELSSVYTGYLRSAFKYFL